MARKAKRKYSRGAGADVKNEMHRYKRGTAKSGPGGKGGKVKSRKQAIAIGLALLSVSAAMSLQTRRATPNTTSTTPADSGNITNTIKVYGIKTS